MRPVLHAMPKGGLALVTAVATAGVFVLTAAPASAATAVTLYVDKAGTSSTCSGPGAAACPTVQQAVTVAESRTSSDVTVSIAAGTYTENVAVGTVPAGDTLSLAGAGQASTTLDGGGAGPVISQSAGVLRISGLTITNGTEGVDVQGNASVPTSLSLSRVTAQNNSADAVSVVQAYGGTVSIDRSELRNNASNGVVMSAYSPQGTSPLSVTRTTVAHNAAQGVSVRGVATIAVESDTFDSNAGTGLWIVTGQASVTNSTLFANGTNMQVGNFGPIFSNFPASAAITNSTFVELTASAVNFNNNFFNGLASVTLSGSLFDGGNCSLSNYTDNGYNVESGSTCTGGAPTDKQNSTTIEVSHTLQANGSTGPQTLAIAANSSARDLVPSASCPATDERGVSRAGATCDAGAYEFNGTTKIPPSASDTSVVSRDGAPVTVDLATITDAYGLTPRYKITAKPAHGTATLSGSVVTYKPTKGYYGDDAFTYSITTSAGTASGTIKVTDLLSPVANADKAGTYGSKTGPGTTIAIEVLGNDSPNGGTLTVTAVSTPAHGSSTTDGTVARYTPAKGFFGTDTFTYTESTSSGTASATVTVVVQK